MISLAAAALTLMCAAGPAAAEATGAAPAAILAEADRLYLHRDQGSNLSAAVVLLEERARVADADPQVLWRLGRCLVRQGELRADRVGKLAVYARAEEVLRRAVDLAPREADAHYWLGIAMGRRGETRGILRSLFLIGPLRREMRTVLELDSQNGGAHHVLGEMLREIPAFAGGDKKAAARELETAARLEPDEAAHFTALARAYLDLGRPDQARAVLEHVFTIRSPADPGEYAEDVLDAREMLKKLR